MKFFQYEKFTEVNRSLAKEAYYAAKKILNFSHVALVMLDVDHIKQQGSVTKKIFIWHRSDSLL